MICRNDFKKYRNKVYRDNFRHNHYPTIIVQFLKFSYEKCVILKVSEFIPTLMVPVIFIELNNYVYVSIS